MSEDDPTEPDDGDEESREQPRARGFHLEAGLRSLTGLLGDLLEASAEKSRPPPDQPVDWSTVDNDYRGPQRRDTPASRSRRSRRRGDDSDSSLVETRIEDDEFVVHADIPGATKDALSVGINPRTNDLVIGQNDRVIARVDIPWASHEATNVWFNNGVLEVRIEQTEPDGG